MPCFLLKYIYYIFIISLGEGHAVCYVGSYFPDQGSNPCLLQWKCEILTIGPPGKSEILHIFIPVLLLQRWWEKGKKEFTTVFLLTLLRESSDEVNDKNPNLIISYFSPKTFIIKLKERQWVNLYKNFTKRKNDFGSTWLLVLTVFRQLIMLSHVFIGVLPISISTEVNPPPPFGCKMMLERRIISIEQFNLW